MPRHWQVLIMAALGIGATLVAVPRALSGIVAVPQGGSDPGISRTSGPTQTAKANTATMPGWSPSPATSATPDTKPPSVVTNLRITSNSDTAAIVSWETSNDNVAVRGYIVRMDGSSAETPAPPVNVPWARRTGPVTVQVAAIDSSGNQSDWRSIVVSPPKPVVTQAPTTAPPPPPPVPVDTGTTTATPTQTTTEPTTPPTTDAVTTSPSQPGSVLSTEATAAQESTQPV